MKHHQKESNQQGLYYVEERLQMHCFLLRSIFKKWVTFCEKWVTYEVASSE